MNEDGKPYRKTVGNILNQLKPRAVLDIACGDGWLSRELHYRPRLHGIDFYAPPAGYDAFYKADINQGIPSHLQQYDAVVVCEAMSYVQNPGLFIKSIREHLSVGGIFIITDPNPIYPGARLNYLIQGAPRSQLRFVQNETRQSHMPWLALSFFQLWLLLGLNGFEDITINDVDEEKPKHLWEISLGLIAKMYYRSRQKKSRSASEYDLFSQALSNQNIYGRRLVISAIAAEPTADAQEGTGTAPLILDRRFTPPPVPETTASTRSPSSQSRSP